MKLSERSWKQLKSAIYTGMKHPESERVYFIRSGDDDAVKIGWSKDPFERINYLQPGNPNELRLILTIPGPIRTEQELHRFLHKSRLRGEWFRLSGMVDHTMLRLLDARIARVYDGAYFRHSHPDFQRMGDDKCA